MKKYSIGKNTITRLMKRYGVALNSVVNAKRISLDELNSVKDKGMTLKQLWYDFYMDIDKKFKNPRETPFTSRA